MRNDNERMKNLAIYGVPATDKDMERVAPLIAGVAVIFLIIYGLSKLIL